MSHAHVSAFERLVVSLVVVLDEMFPESLLSHVGGIASDDSHLLLVELGEFDECVADSVADLIEVVVRTMHSLHSVFYLDASALEVISPNAEAGKVGSDARHVECHGLSRRVAPRLIV